MVYQDIIKAGRTDRQHCLEVSRDDYLSHYWQEVRILQSELLLAGVVVTYKKRLWVTNKRYKNNINFYVIESTICNLLRSLGSCTGRTRGDAKTFHLLPLRVCKGCPCPPTAS